MSNYNFELYTSKGEDFLNNLFNHIKNDLNNLRLTRSVTIERICNAIDMVTEVDNSISQNDIMQNIVNYWNFIFNIAKFRSLTLEEIYFAYEKNNQNGVLTHKEIPKNISLLIDTVKYIDKSIKLLLESKELKISVSNFPPYAVDYDQENNNSDLIIFLWHGDSSNNLYINGLLNGDKQVQYLNMFPTEGNKSLSHLNKLFPHKNNKKIIQDLVNLSYQINCFNMSVSLINKPSKIDYNLDNILKTNGVIEVLWEGEMVPQSSIIHNKEFLQAFLENHIHFDYLKSE
jgi:hypothetical protein